MRTTKKITSIVLSVLMVVSMMSVMAVTASATTSVAKVGETEYDTLQAAINAAQNGDTVKLVADITDTSITYPGDTRFAYFVTGKSGITIDGDGHTVNVGGRGFGVAGDGVGANITFKNITINNSTPGTSTSGRAIDTRGNKISTFTLDNVALNCTSTSGNPQALTIGGSQDTPVNVNIIPKKIRINKPKFSLIPNTYLLHKIIFLPIFL